MENQNRREIGSWAELITLASLTRDHIELFSYTSEEIKIFSTKLVELLMGYYDRLPLRRSGLDNESLCSETEL